MQTFNQSYKNKGYDRLFCLCSGFMIIACNPVNAYLQEVLYLRSISSDTPHWYRTDLEKSLHYGPHEEIILLFNNFKSLWLHSISSLKISMFHTWHHWKAAAVARWAARCYSLHKGRTWRITGQGLGEPWTSAKYRVASPGWAGDGFWLG